MSYLYTVHGAQKRKRSGRGRSKARGDAQTGRELELERREPPDARRCAATGVAPRAEEAAAEIEFGRKIDTPTHDTSTLVRPAQLMVGSWAVHSTHTDTQSHAVLHSCRM